MPMEVGNLPCEKIKILESLQEKHLNHNICFVFHKNGAKTYKRNGV